MTEEVDGLTLQARDEMFDEVVAIQGHELDGVKVEAVERADGFVRVRLVNTNGTERSRVELRTALERMLASP